jgi:soluble lytic murein transglycosylase-like protein
MPLALWVLFVAMTLAVYMTSVYEDPYRPQPKTKNPAVAQIRPAPLLLPQTSENEFAKKSDTLAPVADQESVMPQAANRHEVDPAIVKAIIMAESSYNPRAVSKRGAKGLMQLMPKTAEEMGVEDIFNPEHNINGGVRYYKKLLKQFKGDVKLALAAYNAGTRKVKEHNGVPPYKSTRYYIKKVFEYYQYYKNQVETDKA